MKQVTLCLASVTCPCDRFEDNLATSIRMIRTAAAKGADIMVFPEMSLTGYTTDQRISAIARPVDARLIHTFSRLSDELNLAILPGLAEKADGHIYGSHLVFVPRSSCGKYRKLHIAPNEQDFFSPGVGIPLFMHAGLRFGIQLCYDAHFPELSTAMAVNGADLIVFPHASPRERIRTSSGPGCGTCRPGHLTTGCLWRRSTRPGTTGLASNFPACHWQSGLTAG
jgi:N-carbamoylputrescine amidase